jgi:hypothetical protein
MQVRIFFLGGGQQSNSGLCCLVFEVSGNLTQTHTHTNTQPLRLFHMSDQLVVEAASYTTYNKRNRRKSMPSAGCEPAVPANKRL